MAECVNRTHVGLTIVHCNHLETKCLHNAVWRNVDLLVDFGPRPELSVQGARSSVFTHVLCHTELCKLINTVEAKQCLLAA